MTDNQVESMLSFSAKLVGFPENGQLSFWLLFGIITVLSIIVYKLGFAKKLTLGKNLIIYFLLAIGCFPITLFGIKYPIAEVLAISVVVLAIYKIRLHQSKKQQTSPEGEVTRP